MGYENTAFAIGLVGCNGKSNRTEREECYRRSDYPYIERKEKGDKASYLKMIAGLRSSIEGVISREFLPYVHLLPQAEFNSYKVSFSSE